MKNLKKFDNALTRTEMKNISGGIAEAADGKAGCCYLRIGRSPYCGLTKTEARAMYAMSIDAGATNTGWCCASC